MGAKHKNSDLRISAIQAPNSIWTDPKAAPRPPVASHKPAVPHGTSKKPTTIEHTPKLVGKERPTLLTNRYMTVREEFAGTRLAGIVQLIFLYQELSSRGKELGLVRWSDDRGT